uniref:Mitochondrial ribosomal protein S30 n=1 Tax=Cyprinodon variegatus TaxID=28743 RepID=A0A3Q2D433_CYPVA
MAARTRLSLLLPKSLHPLRTHRHVHTEAAVKEPSYPPIVASLTAKSKAARLRQIEERVKKICASPLDEKLSLITRIQRMKFVVYPQTFARNPDRWHQHFTKTAYIPGLPEKFSPGAESPPAAQDHTAATGIDDAAFSEIRDLVTRVILHEHWHKVKKHLNPQVSFYWRRGTRTIPKGHRKGRLEPIRFQIDDHPHSQIRIPQQLPQFAPLEASYTAEVPEVPYAPNLMPLFRRQYENNIFTGAKLPDPVCYGHTQFHLVPDRYHRERLARQQQSDQVEAFLRANAVASLFAWTGAQATYQGFWNYEDVSRPFVSQAVITDGHYFSFFCYQLNTVALSSEVDGNNPRKNILWGTESLRLYQDVQDGEVVGLDDGVVRLLVQFLMNQPHS